MRKTNLEAYLSHLHTDVHAGVAYGVVQGTLRLGIRHLALLCLGECLGKNAHHLHEGLGYRELHGVLLQRGMLEEKKNEVQ